jgi:broad specificity phosphatase PhoE
MAKLILVSSGDTEWRAQERLAGDVDLSLNEAGRRQAHDAAQAIASQFPQVVRCGPEQATRQTASIIAHELSLKFRTVEALREVDLGVWEGLTVAEFSERYARVHKQWRLDAKSVEPPDGESIPTAEARLLDGLKRVMKRHRSETVAVVLGPLAVAILRCRLVEGTYARFWEFAESPPAHQVIDPVPAV